MRPIVASGWWHPSASPRCGEGEWRRGADLADQKDVVAFLEQGGLGGPVERIDTHAAIVLLTRDKAFKLKRAVRFSFLDFSTLERRRSALEAELSLNRRTAPRIYRRLVAVTRRPDGELELDGEGEVVEWLLEMERFPLEARLDLVAASGALDRALAERSGERVAAFHGRLAARPGRGGAAGLAAVIAGNARDLRELVPDVLAAGTVEGVVRRIDEAFAAAVGELDDRRSGGLVRHVHGDLHLANIVLLEGEPVPFDCLEFDEELATIDVLYDLAFLLMDLLARDLPEAANACLRAWVDARLDDRGPGLLPLLIAVRATIRAKVEGFTARHLEATSAIVEHRAAAARYLELAGRVLEPRRPCLVAIGGRSGTGKSSVARALAPGLGVPPGAPILRSDVIRKRLHGVASGQRLPEEAYAAQVSERVFEAIAERAERFLQGGCAVVCDAVYGLPEQRARLAEIARRVGVPFTGLWLEASEEVLEARVAARSGDASDADVSVVRRQAERVIPPAPAEGWHRVPAGDRLDLVLARARNRIGECA